MFEISYLEFILLTIILAPFEFHEAEYSPAFRPNWLAQLNLSMAQLDCIMLICILLNLFIVCFDYQ